MNLCGDRVPLTDEQIAAIEADPENPMNWCCYGVANAGVRGCTCWRPVFSIRRRAPIEGVSVTIRDEQCGDCAYRSGSAEYEDDAERENLTGQFVSDGVFFCHQDSPHVIRWRHPRGMIVEVGTDAVGAVNAYEPRWIMGEPADLAMLDVSRELDLRPTRGVPVKGTGRPLDVCAGWAARRRALVRARGRA